MASFELNVDLHELKHFIDKLTSEKLFKEYAKKALVEAAIDFIKAVKPRTPKTGEPNPITGRVWNIPQNHPAGQLRNSWDEDNQNIEAKVVEKNGGFEITLYNNTYYASWVEKGHRKFVFGRDTNGWVMGSFFLKRTEVEFENGALAKSVQKKLNDWIKEVVNGK